MLVIFNKPCFCCGQYEEKLTHLSYLCTSLLINYLPGKNAALKMMKANEDLLKSIITLTQASVDGPCDVKLVAETLGFFCSCGNLSLFFTVNVFRS